MRKIVRKNIKDICDEMVRFFGDNQVYLISSSQYFGEYGYIDPSLEGESSKADVLALYDAYKAGNVIKIGRWDNPDSDHIIYICYLGQKPEIEYSEVNSCTMEHIIYTGRVKTVTSSDGVVTIKECAVIQHTTSSGMGGLSWDWRRA